MKREVQSDARQGRQAEKVSRWIIHHEPRPEARIRLFCFPYAGGSALIYRKWHQSLPGHTEVCAIQPPGRGGRIAEPGFTKVGPLVDAVGHELIPRLDKPFVFFGHSMGAIIAFELCRWLRWKSLPLPERLIVSGHTAPQIEDEEAPTYNLPDEEFIEDLRKLNGTPAEVLDHPELMQLMLPSLRADFELIQTYSYCEEPPLAIPITAMGGLDDKFVSREDLEAWKEQTLKDLTLRLFSGDHFFLHSASSALLHYISADLHKAVSKDKAGNRAVVITE